MKSGSCLCGAVKYEVTGPLRDVLACHCGQCRKQTGNYMTATAAKDTDLRIVEDRGLKWYRSSNIAKRGFCAECGSVLFWKGDGRDYTAITAGSIDGKTGLALEGHIFCDTAGDYYQITGGAYRSPSGRPPL
ncbi:MAG: GFA family protein [Aestuariivirga sp.]